MYTNFTVEKFRMKFKLYKFLISLASVQRTCLVAQLQRICLGSLGREDTLEKEIATHSDFLTWEIPLAEETVGLRAGHDWAPKQQLHT